MLSFIRKVSSITKTILNKLTAKEIARNVLPVPAGPMPNTTSFLYNCFKYRA